ncbi:MAG: YitT family protein, partial [Clostridia bacterium]|nr:YitT family protein [Clostridia bacterium]
MKQRKEKPLLTKAEKRKKVLNTVLYWVVLNAGTLVLAAGVYFFKAPNNFATGGVSGLSIILAKFISPLTNNFLGQPEIMMIINVLLLIIGFIFLGKGCTFKTAYCSVVYTLEQMLFKFIPLNLPLTATEALPQGQVFLEFVFAMLLTGAGAAIIFNCKASSGGTDIVALIIKKYTKIKVGYALLITDFLIAASTFFIFDVKTGLFSILGLFAKAFLVDGVIENIGKSKFVTIITSNPEQTAEFILNTMHRGFTSYKATGGYTHEEKTVML